VTRPHLFDNFIPFSFDQDSKMNRGDLSMPFAHLSWKFITDSPNYLSQLFQAASPLLAAEKVLHRFAHVDLPVVLVTKTIQFAMDRFLEAGQTLGFTN
jgi:hypothetical protein